MNEIVAIEEHYAHPEVAKAFNGLEATKSPVLQKRLEDLAETRIRDMDAAGITMQVLSHTAPAVQKVDADTSVRLAQLANDALHRYVRANSKRFAAFATIPTPSPKAAADELERTVTKLGFKGAMVHGLTNGLFLDNKMFWPIFERAQALDVPIYVHPSLPHQAVIDTYYKDYTKDWPVFMRAAWGFTVESATQAIRLVLSGVLDEYPRTQIILGHLGEGIPFFLWRINHSLSREGRPGRSFRETFCEHFHITTSGFFSTPALLCCAMELGIDRILFSVDYPFIPSKLGTDWLREIPLCAEDRKKLMSENSRRLLKLD